MNKGQAVEFFYQGWATAIFHTEFIGNINNNLLTCTKAIDATQVIANFLIGSATTIPLHNVTDVTNIEVDNFLTVRRQQHIFIFT